MAAGGRLGRRSAAGGRGGSSRSRRCAILVLIALGGAPGAGRAADERLPARIGADALHGRGITGHGVTIAVIGAVEEVESEIPEAADGHPRLLATHDALRAARRDERPATGGVPVPGGRSLLLEAMLSGRRDGEGRYAGVAPNADLVLVAALGPDGAGRPTDIAQAVAWVVARRDRYGIQVLSLPPAVSARPGSLDSPLARAVLDAWRAGIVVVAAAGDGGPAPVSIASPGDLPWVITVGAAAMGPGGVFVPTYSASGPTFEGFVKPEIVAPPGTVMGEPSAAAGGAPRRSPTGTSVSTAVVSGAVALVLEATPWLTPDEVKYRLLTSARPVVTRDGERSSILRQGAGLIDALAAADAAEGGALRGMTWSDSALRGMTWSD
jgi:serine protease AprX